MSTLNTCSEWRQRGDARIRLRCQPTTWQGEFDQPFSSPLRLRVVRLVRVLVALWPAAFYFAKGNSLVSDNFAKIQSPYGRLVPPYVASDYNRIPPRLSNDNTTWSASHA